MRPPGVMGSENAPYSTGGDLQGCMVTQGCRFWTFGDGVAGDRRRRAGSAGGSGDGHVPAVRIQVGAPLPGGRPSRVGEPIVAAALLPHAHQPRGGRAGVTGAAGVAGRARLGCRLYGLFGF